MRTYFPRHYGWRAMRRERERARALRVLAFVAAPLAALILVLVTR